MQVCPRCGVRNLDSDIQCFNCEEILDGKPFEPRSGPGTQAGPESERPAEAAAARPRRSRQPEPSFVSLLLGSLVVKLLGLVMAFGLFSIVALVVMEFGYTSTKAFHASLALLGAAALAAFLYPGIRRAGLNGKRGGLVSLLTDIALFAAFLPPVYLALEKKLSGSSELIVRYWWALPVLLGLDFLASQVTGTLADRRRSARRDAVGRKGVRAPGMGG
jgi:hypothetical protein